MPTPAQDVFEKGGTYSGWDEDYYPAIGERYYDLQVARMLALMQIPAGGTVLDAGCGPGVHAIRAAKAGYRVHAIDFSAVAIQEAERRVAAAGVGERVTFEQADLTRLPFADAAYRHVFSWGVVIHIPEVERAFAELARILAPGGRLAIYLLNRSGADPKMEAFGRFVLRKSLPQVDRLPLGTRTWYTLHGERLCVWRFDIRALTRHFAALGLNRVARVPGVLSEAQRRVKGTMRNMLLRLNNVYARAGLFPGIAATNLLVFEKPA